MGRTEDHRLPGQRREGLVQNGGVEFGAVRADNRHGSGAGGKMLSEGAFHPSAEIAAALGSVQKPSPSQPRI